MGVRRAWVGGIIVLGGMALLAIGCVTGPRIVGTNGLDAVPLNTVVEVHDALGIPVTKGITPDGRHYEDYKIKNGCDEILWGRRVPAFHPLEEFHIHGGGEVQLIAVRDVREVPTTGKNLVVVAAVNNQLSFRLFDAEGKPVLQADEPSLAGRGAELNALKQQLANEWPPHQLTGEEKEKLVTAVAAVVSNVPPGSFEIGLARDRVDLLPSPSEVPTEGALHRVFPGETLRFVYDRVGRVEKVLRNGEVLVSAKAKVSTGGDQSWLNVQGNPPQTSPPPPNASMPPPNASMPPPNASMPPPNLTR